MTTEDAFDKAFDFIYSNAYYLHRSNEFQSI